MHKRITRYDQRFHQVVDLATVPGEGIVYCTLRDTMDRLEPARARLDVLPGVQAALYRDVYADDLWYLEVFSAEASKRNAALYLKEAYGFARVVGFGDNLNDLPLFDACDYRCAVANAYPEVLAAADEVIGPNTEDGVARWLAKLRG